MVYIELAASFSGFFDGVLRLAFIKNPDLTITDLVKSKIAELGENIIIRRFTRYALGGE